HILPPAQRTLGNSILQSGAAIGAILTPLLIRWITPEHWRTTFVLVGLLGFAWVVLWLASVRTADLKIARHPDTRSLMEVVGWLPRPGPGRDARRPRQPPGRLRRLRAADPADVPGRASPGRRFAGGGAARHRLRGPGPVPGLLRAEPGADAQEPGQADGGPR